MPEFVEAEAYRRTLAPVVGARVETVEILDDRLLRRGDEAAVVRSIALGASVVAARRHGKVVLIDLDAGHSIALGFGLRGWLSLDGRVARASGGWRDRSPRPEHVRLRLRIGGRCVELEDQLRLATLQLDIDEGRLGTDVLELDKRGLRAALQGRGTAIKTVLMDQRRIAGVGNLIADEVLFQGRIDPRTPADAIDGRALDRLWDGIRRTRRRVLDHNGSHQGVLIRSGARERGERCPRCDVEIRRIVVGGRTTYFCPNHQR